VAVSKNGSEEQGFFARRFSAKWLLLGTFLLVAVMVSIVVTLLLVDRSRDEARRAAVSYNTTATNVTSPYDFAELPAETDLDVVADAAFVSIFVPNDTGTMTSYAISLERPEAQALVAAIRDSDEAGVDASGDAALTPTITFVFPNRDILTFTLDLEQGLIARSGQSWHPAGPLRALVEAATAKP
jgi:hypothetical protein